jgi:hypothetical protein
LQWYFSQPANQNGMWTVLDAKSKLFLGREATVDQAALKIVDKEVAWDVRQAPLDITLGSITSFQ